MQAIVMNDMARASNNGKKVNIIAKIPKDASVSVFPLDGESFETSVVEEVYLVDGVSNLQKSDGSFVECMIEYKNYKGTATLASNEIAVIH